MQGISADSKQSFDDTGFFVLRVETASSTPSTGEEGDEVF
jgi:hypothetical protein